MKPGDTVQVITKDETLEGILIPSPELEKDTVILKLDSGYNIGIDKKHIKKIATVKSSTEKKAASAPSVKQNKNLPTISIMHTGGTIASKVDYKTGGVTAGYSPDEMLQMIPELHDIANVRSRKIISLQSEMIRFPHYNALAKEIEKEIKKGCDGIIITHGTDTLHYTAAALAFMIENSPIPIILVGAQRSFDRGSSDASLNWINAAYFAAHADFSGVAICMHETSDDNNCLILPATKTRKMHTSRRDAFRPINTTAIARINYQEEKISFIQKKHKKRNKEKVAVTLMNDKLKIGFLKSHINMFAAEIDFYKDFDGLVLEGTGLGHMPNEEVDEHTKENKKIQEAIANLVKSGVVVVMTPQTIYGRIQMNVYTPQRELLEVGVLGNFNDMTPETTFIKLAWLLSNFKKDEVKDLLSKNLRGELTDRTEEHTFLV